MKSIELFFGGRDVVGTYESTGNLQNRTPNGASAQITPSFGLGPSKLLLQLFESVHEDDSESEFHKNSN